MLGSSISSIKMRTTYRTYIERTKNKSCNSNFDCKIESNPIKSRVPFFDKNQNYNYKI